MTEDEWPTCREPQKMLRYLDHREPGRHDRKFRLFACACLRHHWHRLHPTIQQSVELAERHLEGLADEGELRRARESELSWIRFPVQDAWGAADLAVDAANELVIFAAWDAGRDEKEDFEAEKKAECNLIRCVFGNPFRPVAFDPSWRTRTATTIAQVIYDERDFSTLPVLADALEDAGCEHADVLSHCRQPGEHVRGCWVVDLVLGKE
jgi:hypothetical protein